MTTMPQVWFWVFTTICAGAGAYLGAYLKKKGENVATHEDLDKLVIQMKATTEATRAIEARISNEVWDRQKQWELKRDTVISLIQTMDAAKDALMRYAAKRQGVEGAGVDPNRFELVMDAATIYIERAAEFDAKRVVAALICSQAINNVFWDAQQAIRDGYSRACFKNAS